MINNVWGILIGVGLAIFGVKIYNMTSDVVTIKCLLQEIKDTIPSLADHEELEPSCESEMDSTEK